MSVVLADDDVHTRTGVCLTLEDAGFTVLAEVGDACAAVDASMRLHPALCVIEIKLPGGALKAIATIRRGRPDTAVVVLTLASSAS